MHGCPAAEDIWGQEAVEFREFVVGWEFVEGECVGEGVREGELSVADDDDVAMLTGTLAVIGALVAS